MLAGSERVQPSRLVIPTGKVLRKENRLNWLAKSDRLCWMAERSAAAGLVEKGRLGIMLMIGCMNFCIRRCGPSHRKRSSATGGSMTAR